MTKTPAFALALGLALAAATAAQAPRRRRHSKLGTFERGGKTFLGLVLDDTRVLDIAQANAAFEKSHPKAAKVAMPSDMTVLIERYDNGVGDRLRAIANAAGKGAAYEHPVGDLKVLPPVRPQVILNAGANYPEHAAGIVAQGGRGAGSQNNAEAAPAAQPQGRPAGRPLAPAQSASGIWERPVRRHAAGQPVPLPEVAEHHDRRRRRRDHPQRPHLDRLGMRVRRGGRQEGPERLGQGRAQLRVWLHQRVRRLRPRGPRRPQDGRRPDWFQQKNHDTFAPLGPYIVPKEFIKEPMNTRHFFTLNGEIKQDSNTSRMEYNIWENLAYGSAVMTLHPGDLISNGTPPGTNIDRPDARWIHAGDKGVCSIEGVGAQHLSFVAEQ